MQAYRKDIEGLRAVAVLAVIFFHVGVLPAGYAGVDVFFVISGFLITQILRKNTGQGITSLRQFYIRRVRRIVPLTITVAFAAMSAGYVWMLPGDYKRLGESVIATSFFANNILLFFQARDYWDVLSQLKPLLHTWSLAVEEQFYLFYPLLFTAIGNWRKGRLLPVLLLILTLLSLLFYFFVQDEALRFYWLPARFFELGFGGLLAFSSWKPRLFSGSFSWALVAALIVLLCLQGAFVRESWLPVAAVGFTGLLLLFGSAERPAANALLTNPAFIYIGQLGFGLYMWHQPVLAFYRYSFGDVIGFGAVSLCLLVIAALATLTFYIIEQPYRHRIPQKIALMHIGIGWIVVTLLGAAIVAQSGIVRDVPELDIIDGKNTAFAGNEYNNRIRKLDKAFMANGKVKVLIIGNSFARDWANVLLESEVGTLIELSYVEHIFQHPKVAARMQQADFIFFSEVYYQQLADISRQRPFDTSKAWMVSTKNFGNSNGVFYRHRHESNYCLQRVTPAADYYKFNQWFISGGWGHRAVNLMGAVMEADSSIPVFTPECKFISHDGRHFTQHGAQYYAQVLRHHPVFSAIFAQSFSATHDSPVPDTTHIADTFH